MSFTITRKVHFQTGQAGQKRLRKGTAAEVPTLRVPRISRIMALAIHFDQLIREGKVKDYAALARLGDVSRARVTQIMDLLNLAPQIQEQLIFLERAAGRETITERVARNVAAKPCWDRQRLPSASRAAAKR